MEDDLTTVSSVRNIVLRQICPHELKIVPVARVFDIPQLLPLLVVIGETVHAHDSVSLLEKRLDEVGPDKPGTSSHQRPHV
jgi:hypothetical protein